MSSIPSETEFPEAKYHKISDCFLEVFFNFLKI